MAPTVSVDLNVELPLIVFLDDSTVEGFDLSAEEAMVELGIKRSRLSQISGRELRVGKKRVDRYLRPYYRRVDVLAYKEQTRPATTKQQANNALIQATQLIETRIDALLQSTCNQLQQTLVAKIRQLPSELMPLLRQQDGLSRLQTVVSQKIISAIETISLIMQDSFSSSEQSFAQLQQLVGQQFDIISQLLERQNKLLTDLQRQQQLMIQDMSLAVTAIDGCIKQLRITRRTLASSSNASLKKPRPKEQRKQLDWGSVYRA